MADSARDLAKRTVLVVGAGPGGLTLANALQRKGVPVKVFERNPRALGVYGGAYALQSGRDWLDQLGFKERLADISSELPFVRILDHTGAKLGQYDIPACVKEELGGPLFTGVTRNVLVSMLNDNLDPGVLHLGCDLTKISETDDGLVNAHFMQNNGDGTFSERIEQGAVIIGADGIKSKVRELMHGPQALGETGTAAWLVMKRGITPDANPDFDYFAEENRGVYFVAPAPGQVAGFTGYAASPGTFEYIQLYKTRQGESLPTDSWEEAAFAGKKRKAQFLEELKTQPQPFGWFGHAAEDCELVHLGLLDRNNPGLGWHLGRVGMLGDAVHAPLPSAGQGVNGAIGDGACLAKYLAAANLENAQEVNEAFQQYVAERKSFGEQIVKEGRQLLTKPANLLFPQSPDGNPQSAFERWLQSIAVATAEAGFTQFPSITGQALIANFRVGCGKVDLESESIQCQQQEPQLRPSLRGMLPTWHFPRGFLPTLLSILAMLVFAVILATPQRL